MNTDIDLLAKIQRWFSDDKDSSEIPGEDLDEIATCLANAIQEIASRRAAMKQIADNTAVMLAKLQELKEAIRK